MRATEVVFIVRKQADAEILKDLGHGIVGVRRLIVQVAGEGNALTTETLRRLRRSTDAVKRRTPVVVWTENAAEAERWRAAGALAIVGAPNKVQASKALDSAHTVPWVETTIYVGPDRRHKKTWLNRSVRRLADADVSAQPNKAAADSSSFDTRMRQLRFAAFGIAKGDRIRRAQFLTDAKSAVKAAEASRKLHAAAAMESLVRYLNACGASALLDEELIERHLKAAESAPSEAASLIPRLEKGVDRAIGLV